MTEKDKQLLVELDYGIITADIFLKNFSVDIKNDIDFVRVEMINAIKIADPDEIQMTLALIWLSGDISKHIGILNELLINPNHRNHQLIAKNLQDYAPDASTVPFVRKALESNFEYLHYTSSDSRTITK